MKTRAYVTLDGLRGVAALCIVVLHCYRFFGDMTWSSAALAVDLFFVLSGFVLTYAYEEQFAAGMSPWSFIRARIVRLYPLYILGTGLGILTVVLAIVFHRGAIEMKPTQFWISLPFALVMLPAPGDLLFPLNGPMWSVFYELLVNLLWAIFWKPLRSNVTLVALIALSGVALVVSASSRASVAYFGPDWTTFTAGAFRISYSFFLGMLLYRVHKRWRFLKIPPLLLLIALPSILFLPLGPGMQLIAVLLILPCLVLAASQVRPEGYLRVALHQLGAASYALYAVHYPLYHLAYAVALQLLGVDLEEFAPWIGIAFTLGLVGVCLILSHYYDTPARRWLARRWHATIVPEGVTQAP